MLHALAKYAQSRGLDAEPGFKPKRIRWLLLFRPDGSFIGTQPLGDTDDKRNRGQAFLRCPDLSQPELVSSGLRHFLVDSLDVVAMFVKGTASDEERANIASKHDAFVRLLSKASEQVPSLVGLARTLAEPDQLDAIHAHLEENKARPVDLATLAVMAPGGIMEIIVDTDGWHAWWRGFRASLRPQRNADHAQAAEGTGKMRCFLSGELVVPATTHAKISGLADVGGHSAGDVLVSFDKEAFESFGLKQSANSAMSEEMVAVYRAALNDLLDAGQGRVCRLAAAKIVFWYTDERGRTLDVGREIDPLVAALGESVAGDDDAGTKVSVEPARVRAAEEAGARRFLQSVHSGSHSELLGARFNALTLSGNSGRVVIRDWMEGSFEGLAVAIDAWFDDLAIVTRDGAHVRRGHKFLAVAAALERELKDSAPPVGVTLLRIAVLHQPIPLTFVARLLHRVRVDIIKDQPSNHARMGLLRAFCARSSAIQSLLGGTSVTERLNDDLNHPAYLCGRILALLGQIQYKALGDVGAGIIQRYYAATSATPGLVLGRLVRQSLVGHLPKIEPLALRRWFDGRLGELWSRLQQRPPRTLTLEEQSLFALGYYHQLAERGTDASGAKTDAAP